MLRIGELGEGGFEVRKGEDHEQDGGKTQSEQRMDVQDRPKTGRVERVGSRFASRFGGEGLGVSYCNAPSAIQRR